MYPTPLQLPTQFTPQPTNMYPTPLQLPTQMTAKGDVSRSQLQVPPQMVQTQGPSLSMTGNNGKRKADDEYASGSEIKRVSFFFFGIIFINLLDFNKYLLVGPRI